MNQAAGQMTTKGSGAELLARTLKSCGVDRVFALCGDHINHLYRALDLAGIDIVSVHQESAAVHMADGWARATGRPGVALVTGAPGHTNTMTGLACAQHAGSPVLLISGATPLEQLERGGMQVMPQAELARPITKFAHDVAAPDHYGEFCVRSLQIALEGTPGPVNLNAPLNTLLAQCSAGKDGRTPVYMPTLAAMPGCHIDTGSPEIKNAVELLADAQRPILILGSGAFFEYSESEIARVVDALDMPVFTVELARGLLPDDGVRCFGYADPFFSLTFREARDADLVVLAGAQADCHLCLGRLHLFGEHTKFMQIHRDAHKVGMNRGNAAAFVSPVKPILDYFAEASCSSQSRRDPAWAEQLRKTYSKERARWRTVLTEAEQHQASGGIHPLRVCMSLERHVTDNTTIAVDAGDFIHWARSFFPARRKGKWIDGGTFGALGAAFPLGLGAQMASPHDPVWVFLGDGGFSFYSWELITAIEQGMSLKIIVGNDAAWGIEKRLQLNDYGKAVGCDLPEIRYDKFAEIVGARGFRVDDVNTLDAIVDEFVEYPGAAVLDVRIRQLAGRPYYFER